MGNNPRQIEPQSLIEKGKKNIKWQTRYILIAGLSIGLAASSIIFVFADSPLAYVSFLGFVILPISCLLLLLTALRGINIGYKLKKSNLPQGEIMSWSSGVLVVILLALLSGRVLDIGIKMSKVLISQIF